MTSDDRIDQLDARVTRLETRISEDIRKIFDKLEALTVDGVKNSCPSPGACVTLAHDLTHYVKLLTAQTERVERLELKLLEFDKLRVESDRASLLAMQQVKDQFHAIEKQKAWILGVWSAIAFFAAILGTVLTIVISHFLDKL